MLPEAWNKEIQEAIDKAATRSGEANQRTADIANSVGVSVQEVAQAFKDYNSKQESNAPKERRLQRLTIIALIAAAIFTLGLDLLSGGQLFEMRKVYQPIKDQADSARKMLVDANRAWIVPHLVKLTSPLTPGQVEDLLFTYGNSGHEPAKKIGYSSSSRSIPFDVIATAVPATATKVLRNAIDGVLTDTCGAARENQNMGVIYPGDLDGNSTGIKVNPKWITQSIIDGGFILAEGCFVYETMDDWHKSRFCFFFNKPMDGFRPPEHRGYMMSCPTGNDAD